MVPRMAIFNISLTGKRQVNLCAYRRCWNPHVEVLVSHIGSGGRSSGGHAHIAAPEEQEAEGTSEANRRVSLLPKTTHVHSRTAF